MKLLIRKPDTGYLDCNLWVPKAAVNVDGVKNALTFQITERNSISFLAMWKETAHHLIVPREFWDPKDFSFPVVDCRPRSFPETHIKSKVRLDHRFEGGRLLPTGKTAQRDAMVDLERSRGGILQLACGIGKTVVALDFIARRRMPAIIIVDTTQLLKQWQEEIALHLDISPEDVGLIQGPVFDWKKPVVLATYHTLADRAPTMPEEVRRWFGTIVWDEAHHVGAPLFSRSADLFYGLRLGLTATPTRVDGMHVIHHFHIGPVIHKNLSQELRPRIAFEWTGVSLDPSNPVVQQAVRDKNEEFHIGKIASYLGTHRERLQLIVNRCREWTQQGRKVLVLSKSVDGLVNLLATWNAKSNLVTDIPFPSAQDVGETAFPVELSEKDYAKLGKLFGINERELALATARGDGPKTAKLLQERELIRTRFQQHEVWKKCDALWKKKWRAYVKDLLKMPSDAGLMIYKVDADERTAMLRSKRVTFAVMKYGREGLNERSLDTVLVSEPVGDEGALKQLLGRILRMKEGKQEPLAWFLEDDIGPLIGMCKKLRKYLREWPSDEGGPLDYESINYKGPQTWNSRATSIRVPGS